MQEQTDQSFGIIPYRKNKKGDNEFLLILHQSGHWHFPKGHAEIGETPLDTARRELREEVGLGLGEVLNPTKPISEKYSFIFGEATIHKTIHFFVATVIGEYITLQTEEIADAKWLKFSEAKKQLTHENSRETLEEANLLLS